MVYCRYLFTHGTPTHTTCGTSIKNGTCTISAVAARLFYCTFKSAQIGSVVHRGSTSSRYYLHALVPQSANKLAPKRRAIAAITEILSEWLRYKFEQRVLTCCCCLHFVVCYILVVVVVIGVAVCFFFGSALGSVDSNNESGSDLNRAVVFICRYWYEHLHSNCYCRLSLCHWRIRAHASSWVS